MIFREKIGSGGFAVVYRGIWKHMVVAIKKLNYSQEEELAAIRDSFFKEASVMIDLRYIFITHLLASLISGYLIYLFAIYFLNLSFFIFVKYYTLIFKKD